MKTKSNSGFSLVELMVVVAIIGILATVGGPNFIKYQRKAKQTTAKTELSGIYTSEKAFFVEFSQYSSSLSKVGYQPEGFTECANGKNVAPRSYAVGFNSMGFASGLGADACATTTPTHSWGAGGKGAANINVAINAIAIVETTAGSDFKAGAVGAIGGAVPDFWSVDQNNDLINVSSGI